ncbi:hypothetical protein TSAR_005945 [Trichomalopsis sarcophagae]|uniref:Uncharacterized protein n=1 Tax=Trichomalopsis sarcophagae TaxID=543379 RepID=A0A232EZ42_9HYME|nr:hypothetical protein TSAR_005945 [Trichomalopsis sarcophagae]
MTTAFMLRKFCDDIMPNNSAIACIPPRSRPRDSSPALPRIVEIARNALRVVDRMQCSERENASSDEEIHEAVDSILAEDKREKSARKRKRDRGKRRNPSAECKKRRHTGAEKSRRFSLRVMEAMRALERRTERVSKSSATCEIVDYVDRKFRNDGDVDAQVRIALKRLAYRAFYRSASSSAREPTPTRCWLRSPASWEGRAAISRVTKARFVYYSSSLENNPPINKHLEHPPQESSEIDLSIPSSVEEDIFRRRIERDIESLQHRCAPGETEADNATMDVSCERRLRNPAQLNRSVPGSPRKGRRFCARANAPIPPSPAREDDRIVGAVHNPAREIEAAIALPAEFADDGKDDYGPFDVPHEDEQLEEDDDDDDDDEGGDAGEDDNVLRDARIPLDEDRDRELRRWIRNCRRECERRAREGGHSGADGK